MLKDERYDVRVEEPARSALASFDPPLRAMFLRRMLILETDPFVSFTGGFDWVESKAFIALRNAGFPIRRLKARAIIDWRVFYYVDETTRTVLVKEIAHRDDDTYDVSSPLAQRLKRNYVEYLQGR
jgi:mRNA-degrading endonuclease RelE of RelBE toxin-antitoxin system